jgi:hypothetical protein
VAQEDLKTKPPLACSFKSFNPPRGDESMLDLCAHIIEDARAGINGIDADELIVMCEICDDHGSDVKLFPEKKPGAVPCGLMACLIAALALYAAELTCESMYGACNAALCSADCSKCKPYVRFILFLMHALVKCGRYSMTGRTCSAASSPTCLPALTSENRGKYGIGGLMQDAQGTRATWNWCHVLLRRRAWRDVAALN